jgi:hypothetical protein
MKRIIGALLTLACAGVLGCEERPEERVEGEWTEQMTEVARTTCPMFVEGVEVGYAETDGAVALTFTAEDPAEVSELRRRVREMGRMYATYPHHGRVHWREMVEHHRAMHGGRAPMPHGPMPSVDADVVDVEGGARLGLRPEDEGELDEIRAHALAHRERFREGHCRVARG